MATPSTPPPPSAELSFARAEFQNQPPAPDACAYCGRGLEGEYYRVGGRLACATCAGNAQALTPVDTHGAFTKSVLFGAGAAIVGFLGYALFGILTGITLGYAAIGVGYLVGWAMKKGSGGLGGRRYQVVAAVLTYAAVAVAFIPIYLHDQGKHADEAQTASSPQTPGGHAASPSGSPSASQDASQDASHGAKTGFGGFLVAILVLLGIGLASPFLILMSSVGHGLLNLFILFIGIRFAWQFMAGRRVEVEGPFRNA